MRRIRTFVIPILCLIACLVAPAPSPADHHEGGDEASLYDRLGGLPAISVVVSDFLDVMVDDPMLNENPAIAEARERVPTPYLKYHVTAMVCQVTGGPCSYEGRSMEESHAHLDITEAEWDRMVEIVTGVMEKHEVPEKEMMEMMDIIATTKDAIVTAD